MAMQMGDGRFRCVVTQKRTPFMIGMFDTGEAAVRSGWRCKDDVPLCRRAPPYSCRHPVWPVPALVNTLVDTPSVHPASNRGLHVLPHAAEECARAYDRESLRLNGRGAITNFPLSGGPNY